MHVQHWERPVELRTYLGDFRIVASTAEAIGFLLKHWPIDAGGQPAIGRQGFLDALEGAASVDGARAVFVEACAHLEMIVVDGRAV